MAKINPSTHDIDAQQATQLLQALKDCAELSGNRKRLSQRETIVFFDQYLSGSLFGFDEKDTHEIFTEKARQFGFFGWFWTRAYNQLLDALRKNETRLSDSKGVRISYKEGPHHPADFFIFLGAEVLMTDTHDK